MGSARTVRHRDCLVSLVKAAECSGGLNQIRRPGRRWRRPARRDRQLILLSRKRACSHGFHPRRRSEEPERCSGARGTFIPGPLYHRLDGGSLDPNKLELIP
jgi:hypothetical protein